MAWQTIISEAFASEFFLNNGVKYLVGPVTVNVILLLLLIGSSCSYLFEIHIVVLYYYALIISIFVSYHRFFGSLVVVES